MSATRSRGRRTTDEEEGLGEDSEEDDDAQEDTRGRTKKEKSTHFCGSSACIVISVVLALVGFYVFLTVHIVKRGTKSRTGSMTNHHEHKENNLDSHPKYQHHDLSSLLLEGLPPLRRTQQEEGTEEGEGEGEAVFVDFQMDANVIPEDLDLVRTTGEMKPTELSDYDPVEELKFLQSMPG